MFVVWAVQDDMEDLYGDPLAVWDAWAADVRGARIDCGHHLAEEEPERLADELRAFLTGPASPRRSSAADPGANQAGCRIERRV